MTIESNQLWQQVSFDLQQEVGQARWMSTFASTTLIEDTARPANRPANQASADSPGDSPGDSPAGDTKNTARATARATSRATAKANAKTTTKSGSGKSGSGKSGSGTSGKKPAKNTKSANAKPGAKKSSPAKTPTSNRPASNRPASNRPASKTATDPDPDHIHFQLVTPNKVTRDNIVSDHLPDLRRLIAKHCQVDNDKVSLEVQIGQSRQRQTSQSKTSKRRLDQDDQLPPPTDFAATLPFELTSGDLDSDGLTSGHRPSEQTSPEPARPANRPNPAAQPNSTAQPNQTDPNRFNPRFTFDNFVSGSTNRFAYQATLAVAEHPGESYNPLFIYGNVGLGKTHLLQATANFMSRYYSQMRVRYVSTETFLNDFLAAIRKKQGDKFREKYRQLDALILDDIQFLEGKESTQEEIFHTFNYLYENKKQLVISSDRPPDSLQTLENRLRSRFKSGLITDIQPPEVETRLVILQLNVDHHNKLRKSLNRPPTRVPDDVLEFIAENFKENVRELEGALTRVLAHAEIMGVSPTCDTAAELLGDLMSHSPVMLPSAKEIIRLATEVFEVSEEKLTGKSRVQGLVTARHITMYAIREHTDLSYPAIGEFFSGRDHSSVMHAVAKIKRSMKENEDTYRDVLNLTGKINAARRAAKLKTAA